MGQLLLGRRALSLKDLFEVAVNGQKVSLHSRAISQIKNSEKFLKEAVRSGETHYGVNTGFGILSSVRIPGQDLEELQYNILRSHAAGIGDSEPDETVRAMLLLRASTLSHGYSGVSLKLVRQLLALLNKNVLPVVPHQGSVGASGDLAPLAHLSLPLIGEGLAKVDGKVMSGKAALKKVGLKPIPLEPKEGLALINGTQFMTAIGGLTLLGAERLAEIADIAGAMSLEAMRGTVSAFDPDIHRIRPHRGQINVAKNIRTLLNAGKTEIGESHLHCDKVQDPYSLRCMAQVHGASRDTLQFVRKTLETEINSVTDNPLVFSKKKKILSGGNFHGQYVAMAMDALAIAVAELGSISEQRIDKLMNPEFSGLPTFLVEKSGLNSGLMIVQVAAASIVSENKTLCHPASVDSIPTNVDKEDHVSMGAWAARKARRVVDNTRRILAMELLASAQGIDLLRPLKTSRKLEKIHSALRKRVPRITRDRPYFQDVQKIEKLILSNGFIQFSN